MDKRNDINEFRKKRRLRRVRLNIAILVLFGLIALFIALNWGKIIAPLKDAALDVGKGGFPVDLPGSTDYVLDELGDNFCLLTDTYFYTYNSDGAMITSAQHGLQSPALSSNSRRALIYDRNGELLAKNTLAYSLEITPDKVSDLEKTIDALSEIIPITTADRRRFVRLREDLNRYDSIPIRQELTDEEVAVFTGQQWRFPGVEINQREYRVYPEGSVGSHILGYIGSLSQSDKKRLTSEGLIDDYEGERVLSLIHI